MFYLLFFLGLFGSIGTKETSDDVIDPRAIKEIKEKLLLLSEDSAAHQQPNNPTHHHTKHPTIVPTHRPTRNPTEHPTRRHTNRPTGNLTKAPTGNITQVPTGNITQAPTQGLTNSPTFPPRIPTQAPTNSSTSPTSAPTTPMICEVGNNHTFPNPNATHCRSLLVNSTCQLPPGGSWHCLTFDDFGIPTGPDGILVGTYAGYQFQSIDPFFSADFVLVDNNTFTGPINYSSTWPNYIAYSRNIPQSGSFSGRMYRNTTFDVLSLTVASSENTPSILNFYALDSSFRLLYNYYIGNITRQNSFIVLNWTKIFYFQFYGDSPFVYGLDSIVATL